MKKAWIVATVIGVAALLAGLGVLIWYLVQTEEPFETIQLEGSLGDIEQRAGFTRIPDAGEMFWWFYPTQSAETGRPVILWLSGVTDLPPSLSANIGMFGPYDSNLNRRNDSWVDDYNLLFIDAPLGTGFSTIQSENYLPTNADENAEHLFVALESFYWLNPDLATNPLYIFGQGHGAQLALALALRLQNDDGSDIAQNLKGVALGNAIIDPGLTLTKLGLYLEEMGYIDAPGRETLETLSNETQEFLSNGQLSEAFEKFSSLGEAVNEAGAIAVNVHHIIEKLTDSASSYSALSHPKIDIFGEATRLKSVLQMDRSLAEFMEDVVAPALGVQDPVAFDDGRSALVSAFANSYMTPATSLVEQILQTTQLSVTAYNGNLDAVSNTLGQLEWVQNLQWDGQAAFLAQPRQLLVLDRLLQGYFRRSDRLRFYWINAAGQSVPLDSPAAMRRVLTSVVAES